MTTPSPTAAFLAKSIKQSRLSQKEIATRAGFPHPNILSMMKTGETKVPIDRIPALAKACDVEPADFMEIAMQEYQPEVWTAITDSISDTLTADEAFMLEVYRLANKEQPFQMTRPLADLLLNLLIRLAGKKD